MNKIAILLLLSSSVMLLRAAFQDTTPLPQQPAKPESPTFYKDVQPILQNHCQGCHRPGEVAPMSLVTYEQTRPWAGAIAHEVEMKMMPPWFADPRFGKFSNDPSLSEKEISTISAWATAGTPAGDRRDSPPPPKMGSRLEHHSTRSRREDANASKDPCSRRDRVHV